MFRTEKQSRLTVMGTQLDIEPPITTGRTIRTVEELVFTALRAQGHSKEDARRAETTAHGLVYELGSFAEKIPQINQLIGDGYEVTVAQATDAVPDSPSQQAVTGEPATAVEPQPQSMSHFRVAES